MVFVIPMASGSCKIISMIVVCFMLKVKFQNVKNILFIQILLQKVDQLLTENHYKFPFCLQLLKIWQKSLKAVQKMKAMLVCINLKRLSQNYLDSEPNDLICNLNLTKNAAELFGTRLKPKTCYCLEHHSNKKSDEGWSFYKCYEKKAKLKYPTEKKYLERVIKLLGIKKDPNYINIIETM